nr:HAD family hydrolase [Chloroflexota bacterium]
MIDALVFDFDGVILDTETPDYQTWQEVFQSHGVVLELSVWTQHIGGRSGRFDWHGHLEELVGISIDRESTQLERRQRYLEIIRASPVLPGILDYIQDAKRLGMSLGVASSSSREWVEGHLSRLDILNLFDSIRGSDDVVQVKPDPELYLASVSHMGTQPQRALAIEDSAHGVTAAKSAGLFCLAVPNPMTKALPLDHADLRLASLAEMPLQPLLQRLMPGRYPSPQSSLIEGALLQKSLKGREQMSFPSSLRRKPE